MEDSEIKRLISSGKYAEAARACEDEGDLARAQALHERVWDFAAAARLAERRGDLPDLIRLLLDARDLPGAARAIAKLAGAPREECSRAATILERKRMLPEAARLREAIGELDVARDLFRAGGHPLDAGRLDEALGRPREAGAAYERFLVEEAGSPDAPRAEVALARLLGGFGRHEEAVRHFQRALAKLEAGPETSPALANECRAQLVVELAALGFSEAARYLLDRLRATDSSLPLLDAFLAERAHRAEKSSPAGKGPLLAGRYLVERLLGSGGMGRVYLAHDRLNARAVAVKVVAAPVDDRAREGYARFVREARIVAALRHPNIVSVYELHEAEGMLAMEFMAGGTLAERLLSTDGGLAPRRVRSLLEQILAGLAAAHARGVIHRDIKPANVFFSSTGIAKLGDFGVAHLQDLGATQTGGFIGTLAYMSPEQITGAPLTFACDLYALGVTAFQLLTGRLPFRGPDFVGQHLGSPPPRLSSVKPALGPAFDELCARLLAKDPADRFASLDDLVRALSEIEFADSLPLAPRLPREPAEERATVANAPRYRIESEIYLSDRSDRSTVYRALDDRLGRAVWIEQFVPGYFDRDEGARHLEWLRGMAQNGGPHLQRVLRIERDGDAAQVVYEAPLGALLGSPPATPPDQILDKASAADRSAAARLVLALCRALAGPHAAGIAHGALADSVVLEESGPTVLVAGRAPCEGSLADDVAFLRAYAGGCEGTKELCDLAGLAAWAAARV